MNSSRTNHFNFEYPYDDGNVTAYLKNVKHLPKDAQKSTSL